ncbi:MAG: hypothetical protein EXS67_04740 [Candidatus Margulisbacteria bacterium]|nr:hypothetical protein [Candidatus Margulisiibacteriota bacterium]
MTKIAYTVSFVEGNAVKGVASKLFIKDASTILTIGHDHAPLVATFETGEISIFPVDGGEANTHVFKEAFLNCHDNTCTFTIL